MADNNKLINLGLLALYDEKIKEYIEGQSSTANNGTLTIQKNGSNVATFSANQATNTTANIVVPTKASDIGALAADGSNAKATWFQLDSDKIYLGNIDSDSNNGEILEANVSLFKYNDSEVATHNWVESNEVFEKGNVNNSGVLKGSYDGHSNKALSQVSLAMGAASTAGLKGWYYNKINFNTKQIFLTASQSRTVSTTTATSDNNSFTSGYAAGDIISIVNDSKYEYCSKITAVKGNVLTLDSLPFTSSNWHTGSILITPDPDEFSIYCIKYSYSDLTKTLTISKHDVGGVDFGGGALAEGIHTYALNLGAHAEGIQTVVFGQYGHAEGFRTQAAYASHAEGKESEARGATSHAEGVNTRAIGNGTHTEGYRTISKGQGAHAEGHSATLASDTTIAGDNATIISAWNTDKFTLAKGTASHAEGKDTLALGNYSHSEGQQTIAQGSHAHAEGKGTKAIGQGSHVEGETTSATASRAHAEGSGTSATANNAHAEGMNGIASGNSAHAEGTNTIAGPAEEAPTVNSNTEVGNFAHAEGNGTWASGNSAHAEGKKTTASGPYSHAEGYSTIASGNKGHAEGHITQATGDSAHAEGQNTIASHTGSHAGGYQTKTSKNFQTVVGQYNADNANAFFIVGRGSADGRVNAFEAGYDSTNGDFIKVGTEILTASKLAAMKNPADLTFGSKKYDGQTAMTITAADLGLSGAMKFLGTSTTAISDGSTTKIITVSGSSITVSAGNVVLYGGHEYVWTGSAWEELGHEGSFKTKQDAVSSPTASGNTTAFIDTILQDANGKITATKKNVSFPVTSVNGQTGAVKIDLSGYATEEWVENYGFLTASDIDSSLNSTSTSAIQNKAVYKALSNKLEASDLTGYATEEWVENYGFLTSAPVTSVNGKTGVVTLAKGDIGLGNVNNTADANKTVAAAYALMDATDEEGEAKIQIGYSDDSLTADQIDYIAAYTFIDDQGDVLIKDVTKDTLKTWLELEKLGGGDMMKTIYDPDADGIVDNAAYAETAGSADIATNAVNDGTGNNIINTYATKSELANYIENAGDDGDKKIQASSSLFLVSPDVSVVGELYVAADPKDEEEPGWINIKTEISNKVNKVSGKGLSTNDYTTAEKNKLAGIVEGAEKNQNAFSNIKIGNTTIAADSTTDTLTLVAGSNITLTPDATNDQITISATGGSGSGGLDTDGGNAAIDFQIDTESITFIGNQGITLRSNEGIVIDAGNSYDLTLQAGKTICLQGIVSLYDYEGSEQYIPDLKQYLKDHEDRITAIESSICLQEGTQILMADGTTKNIEDIKYGDMIMTYDIDNNEAIPCKSYGSLYTGYAHTYNHYCFDNGSILKVFGGHRLYDADKQELVYFSKMSIGDHAMTPECVPATYCYSPTKVPASVSTRKFTLFCETGLYFANNILCGHPLCQPLDLHIRTHGSVKLSDEDKATLQAYADARDNDYQVELSNPEYVKEATPFWKEQQAAKRKIQENKEGLAARDYKTIKAMQGKLTEEEIAENVKTCEELRAKINEEEEIVAKNKKNIKALQDKYNIHPRKLQVMETINVKDAIAKARAKYKK